MSPQTLRFLYGLGAFIVVAILIDQYDEGHGTGYLWAYTFIVGAGLAVTHAPALAAGLQAVTQATGAADSLGKVN